MRTRTSLLLALLLAVPACRKPRPTAETETATPDAGSAGVWTPSGRVDPEKIGKQVEDTLEKEHEKTLEPKVE